MGFVPCLFPSLAPGFAHGPDDSVSEETLESLLFPGSIIVPGGGVEHSAFALGAHPSPRFPSVAFDAFHEDGSPVGVVVAVDVGFVP